MHLDADTTLEDLEWTRRKWDGSEAYSETKFHDVLLAFAAARRWPDVASNAVDPGWVATKMGWGHASDGLDDGYRTQAWLAVGGDPSGAVSGDDVYHRERVRASSAARIRAKQYRLLS